MAERFIVDGDNVVHARGPIEDHQRARDDLVADVVGWASRSGIEAVIVFDGEGTDRRLAGTQIRYSRRETADTVIERMASREGIGELTVVSSDAVVRHVVHRSSVHAMSVREFLDRLRTAPETPSEGTGPPPRRKLADALDPATRAALERIRRGE
jgi:predicted RNA-binding protein with PIN domain